MAQINDDYYEDLTPESFEQILDDLAGRTPQTGPQVDRQLSAPIGGPTTLDSMPAEGRDGALQRAASRHAQGEPAHDCLRRGWHAETANADNDPNRAC